MPFCLTRPSEKMMNSSVPNTQASVSDRPLWACSCNLLLIAMNVNILTFGSAEAK